MDRSRSPRNLSDEARLLQRLAEPELPPGASDAERAAARADAAAGVEHAANELGGHWAEAYQELRPDWQPARTDICARCGLHPTCGMSVSYNGSWPPTHLCRPCYDAETQPQQPHAFTGHGNRLDE